MPIQLVYLGEGQNERRVALTPETCKKFLGLGVNVHLLAGAGKPAYFADNTYIDAQVTTEADALLARADIVICVQPPEIEQIKKMRRGAVLVGSLAPFAAAQREEALLSAGVSAFSLERLPRTTRAQAMDVLSSQAGMAGYKAVLIGAELVPRFFPMLTTAAGTIRPSKVLVIGAGVAGLQAIATAKRLGAQVEGFDVRPETKEQIESLGGRFLDLGVSAAGEGGYARELTAEERAEQQRRLAEHLKGIDVVICTAAVPGRQAPRIISADMVRGMKAGSVIVDLAAETGGNCELTQAGQNKEHDGVLVAGPVNLAAMGAVHASEMYARNVFNFVSLMIKESELHLDWQDELIAKTCWTHEGASKLAG